jgi:hypothetical protein
MRDNSISSPASHKAMTAPRLNRREVPAGGIALGALTLSGLQIVGGAFSPAFAEPKRGGVLKAAFSAGSIRCQVRAACPTSSSSRSIPRSWRWIPTPSPTQN